MARVAIIGAGIIGVSCAAWAQRDGHTVTVYDPLPPGQSCSFGNAGSIAPGSVVPLATPGILRHALSWLADPDGPLWIDWRYLPRALPWLVRFLRQSSRPRVEAIAAALRRLHEHSFANYRALLGAEASSLLHVSGQLYLYDSEEAFAKDALGHGLRQSFGIRSQVLGPDEIRELEPSLRPGIPKALYLPDFGHCSNPHRLVGAIAESVARQGGTFVRTAVTDFEVGPDGVRAVVTDAGVFACDVVVLAAGIWSRQLADRLGLKVPLESLRGYHAMYPMPAVAPRRAIYPLAEKVMATPMEGGLRVAGTVEIAGLAAPENARRSRALGEAARRYFPGLAREPFSVWMGHRPATPDSLPVIGPSRRHRNVILAFGHGQTGLIAGSTTGRLVADLIARRSCVIDPSPYRVERF